MMKQKIVLLLIAICSCFVSADDKCPKIIKRSQWARAQATNLNYLIVPIPYVVIHHTVTPECSTRSECDSRVEAIRSYHMDELGWGDIGYSFLIGGDGLIYEGCGWSHEGAHTYGYNKKSLGIGFIGNYQGKRASTVMLEAAHKLIQCGKSDGVLRPDVKVIGGRQAISIASPGNELYQQIQDWPEWSSTV